MSSEVEVCNMAISHLGIGKEIANLDTEQSEEASACRRFFDIARKTVLGDLNWTFATKFAVLGLVESDPSDEWDYSYRYPVDCITLRRILSGVRSDTRRTRVPFKILRDTSGRLIYTDEESAEVEYTEDIEDIEVFPPETVLALSFKLAALIAPRLTGGDPFKLGDKMLGLYEAELRNAKKKNMNEEVQDLPGESEFITVRS